MKNSITLLHLEAKPLKNGKTNAKNYPYIDELVSLLKDRGHDTILIRDKIRLKKSIEFIKKSDHIICIDSYLQHLAWYLGKQAIVLWGVSDPELFGHKEHKNLYTNKNFFRQNQFDTWENCPENKDAFVKPKEIIKLI